MPGWAVANEIWSQLRQGTKNLKFSQVYPKKYGKQVARLHLKYIVAWMPWYAMSISLWTLLPNWYICLIPDEESAIVLGWEQGHFARSTDEDFSKRPFSKRAPETLTSSFLTANHKCSKVRAQLNQKYESWWKQKCWKSKGWKHVGLGLLSQRYPSSTHPLSPRHHQLTAKSGSKRTWVQFGTFWDSSGIWATICQQSPLD